MKRRLAAVLVEFPSPINAVRCAVGIRDSLAQTERDHAKPLQLRVGLSLTLTETDAGTVVWSDRLSQSFDELVDVLDDLASRIASTVLGRIEESDIAAARRLKPESMTAYELHLRGLEFHRLGGVTDENLRLATNWFRRSRLYRAASRAALDAVERARHIVAEALAANPELTSQYIQEVEYYSDQDVKRLMIRRLADVGLPRLSVVAKAS